jgi:hypothetical protein
MSQHTNTHTHTQSAQSASTDSQQSGSPAPAQPGPAGSPSRAAEESHSQHTDSKVASTTQYGRLATRAQDGDPPTMNFSEVTHTAKRLVTFKGTR